MRAPITICILPGRLIYILITMASTLKSSDDIVKHYHPRTPENAATRLKAARSILMNYPERSDCINRLYDPEIDGPAPEWLELLSATAENPDLDVFNLRKAFDLSLIAAMEGSRELALENMGVFHQGSAGPVNDHDAAIFWLEEAAKIGGERRHVILRKMADVIVYNDRRFKTPDAGPVFNDVMAKIDEAIAHDNEKACLLKGMIFLLGRGTKADKTLGLEMLRDAIRHALERNDFDRNHTVYSAALLITMHKLVTADPHLPGADAMQDAHGFYREYSQYAPPEAREHLDAFFDLGLSAPYRELTERCCDFARGHASKNDVEVAMSPLMSSGYHDDLYQILYMFSEAHEQTHRQDEWRGLLHKIENTRHNTTKRQVEKSTNDTGPRYNPLDNRGMTILGVWEQAAAEGARQSGNRHDSYVPEAGIQSLEGITTDRNGNIHFQTARDENLPAKLLPEDFRVAMALIFGDPEKAELPEFNLPFAQKDFLKAQDQLHQKKWSPAWLFQTDMGRSLYAADRLIGDIAFEPLRVPVGSPGDTITPEASGLAREFLLRLHNTSGSAFGPEYRRVMLTPEETDISVSRREENGKFLYTIEKIDVRMRVDGEEQLIVQEGAGASLNDTFYRFPRRTQMITDHFNALCLYAPLFGRAREISKLLSALYVLRTSGHTLPEHLQVQATEDLESYRNTPIIQEDLLCRPHIV